MCLPRAILGTPLTEPNPAISKIASLVKETQLENAHFQHSDVERFSLQSTRLFLDVLLVVWIVDRTAEWTERR